LPLFGAFRSLKKLIRSLESTSQSQRIINYCPLKWLMRGWLKAGRVLAEAGTVSPAFGILRRAKAKTSSEVLPRWGKTSVPA